MAAMPDVRVRLALVVALALGAGGCWHRPVRSPGAAYERFAAAVRAGDAAALYRALDQPSQWSVISAHRYYREIVALVAQGYPPEARQRELQRVAGAEGQRPAAFFAVQSARRGHVWLSRYAAGLGAVTRVEEAGPRATVHTDRGGRYELSSTAGHGWGFAGLRAELDELKGRASHDVETARENVKIYEQSGRGAAEPRP